MTEPSAYHVEQAMSAWQSARARLLADDADLGRDEAALTRLLGPLEGDIRDILSRLLRAAKFAAAMADQASEMKSDIQARMDRYRRRSEQLRATAFSILDALGERRIELPDLTASIVAGRATAVVTDEAAVPDEYTKTSREIDKTALFNALRTGNEVPGAVLSNSLPSLQIRSK